MINEYSYEASNFIGLVSDLGGFIEIMFITLSVIPIVYNSKVARKLFVKKLYFIDRLKEKGDSSTIERFDPVLQKNFT